MRPTSPRSLLLLAAFVALPATALADVIVKLDGSRLEDVTIQAETLTQIVYRARGRSDATIPIEQVLRVEYEREPNVIGEAEVAIEDGNTAQALLLLTDYVEGHLDGTREERRHEWAPAYAQYRIVEIQQSLGDLAATDAAARRLIEAFPESRYVPPAYLARADALALAEQPDAALAVLEDLGELVATRNLSSRWKLEARLARATLDPTLDPDARINQLESIQSEAGDEFPTVVSRALVARGESYLTLAQRDEANAPRHVAEARDAFESVIEDARADAATLAGAWTGLGDCRFQVAAGPRDEEGLNEAALAYLRVTVLFPEQVRYVPKAMFLAGRSFDLQESEANRERARRLYRRVVSEFPGSSWALEAKGYL